MNLLEGSGLSGLGGPGLATSLGQGGNLCLYPDLRWPCPGSHRPLHTGVSSSPGGYWADVFTSMAEGVAGCQTIPLAW